MQQQRAAAAGSPPEKLTQEPGFHTGVAVAHDSSAFVDQWHSSTAPVSVACFVSYTTVCGMGLMQAGLDRRLRLLATPDASVWYLIGVHGSGLSPG